MSVSVSGTVPAVSLPRPVTRSVSLLFFAFLLPFSGPGPGLWSPPLTVPRPVSVSALLRPGLRSGFASLGNFSFFFFFAIILQNKNNYKLDLKSDDITHLAVRSLRWVFGLILPGQGSSLLQLFPDDLLVVDGNPREPEQYQWVARLELDQSTHLVSNHSSLVIMALINSPIVMDFPPPAFTSISWILKIILRSRMEIVLGVLEANHSRK